MTPLIGDPPGAIVLAGGRGSRMGGVRKADLVVGGRRLLDVVLDACVGCAPIVVVGDADLAVPPGVLRTRESPPFAGPAAALGAGLRSMREQGTVPDWVVCLGCDQPGAPDAVPALIEAAAHAPGDVEAISAAARPGAPSSSSAPTSSIEPRVDELREEPSALRAEPPEVRRREDDSAHRVEWMLAILRTGALTTAIAARGEAHLVDCSMRRLLAPLRWAAVCVPAGTIDDIDTWDDHARWERRVGPA